MTENRRIFWNIVATYGRSLYGLILGLFCGRWTLMALGQVDYGLYGLVGGLTVFIAFFNGVLAGANARFYAYSIGAAITAEDKALALEECRHWFNTALSIHTVVPFLVIAVGYPVGAYAIEQWLTIPADRVAACVWVFRFVCISCFIGMVNVPFSAMYGAKQYIAELTIYSFVTSTLNVVVLYYMVSHPDVWLVRYAAWTCVLGVIPQIIICMRACCIFPECRVKLSYMWDISRLRKVGAFSFWQIMGSMCGLLRNQGMSIVVNKFFGATMNAAQTVGNSVQGHCNTLAGAMQGAFVPVITQAYGAGDYTKMNEFVIRVCKFNVLLSAIFMVPVALELPEIMRLWLKEPPDFSVGLCYCAMAHHLVQTCTVGHMVAVNASGRIASYQVVLSIINIFTVPFAVAVGFLWRDVYLVMIVVVVFEAMNSLGRILFARHIVGTSIRAWVNGVFWPLFFSLVVCLISGSIPSLLMPRSFSRICTTTLVCEGVLLPLVWFVLLSKGEKDFLAKRLDMMFGKIFNRV